MPGARRVGLLALVAGCRIGFDPIESRVQADGGNDAVGNDAADSCAQTSLDRLDCAPIAGCLAAPLCSQLVVLLHFDGSSQHGETATFAHDFSGSGNHVTCPAGSACPVVSAGKFGGGFTFDGLAAFTAPDSPSLAATDGVTMSAWIRPTTSIADYAPLITRWQPGIGDSNYRLARFDTQFFVNYGVGYNWQNHPTPAGYENNSWYHVVGTIDDATNRVRIWVNGAIVADVPTVLDSEPNAGRLWIGWAPEESGIVGVMDELAVWTRVLSDSEIAALY